MLARRQPSGVIPMILVSPQPMLSGLHFGHARGHRRDAGGPPVITHRFNLRLEGGVSEVVPQASACASVRCTAGSVWITHDGDPKDVVLGPGESYDAPRPAAMLLHALQPCAIEMQFTR
jgi:hypothetical protein